MFRFEKLLVWQKAIGFADQVYAVTRGFPSEERFGMTSQMRRAAVLKSIRALKRISRRIGPNVKRAEK